MILDLFKRKKANAALVNAQYEVITQSAREPSFYQNFDVPDTVMGRFNMVSIFMTLYLRATKDADEGVKQLAQEVVEEFFKDIDHSIRELGIGDAGVPKRMKKLGRMFYGRAENYGTAFDNSDVAELAEAFARNIHADAKADENDTTSSNMQTLAEHALFVDKELKNASHDDMIRGELSFPTPVIPAPVINAATKS